MIESSMGFPERKFCITGSGGYVGSALSRRIVERGNKCVALPRLAESHAVREFLTKERPSVLIHAGWSGHPRSNLSLQQILEVNVFPAITLVAEALAADVARFVFLSTSSLNGENAPSDYAIGKLMTEQSGDLIASRGKMSFASVRLAPVYGPGEPAVGLCAPNTFIRNFLDGKANVMFGDVTSFRKYLYIDDAVAAVEHVANDSLSDVSTVEGPEQISLESLVTLCELVMRQSKEPTPFQSASEMDSSKEESKPQVSIEKGLKAVLAYELGKRS
jgi:nucleoside-diphosphate-sugar epimerase